MNILERTRAFLPVSRNLIEPVKLPVIVSRLVTPLSVLIEVLMLQNWLCIYTITSHALDIPAQHALRLSL